MKEVVEGVVSMFEKSNGETAVFLVLVFALGVLAAVVALVPTITRLQSQVRYWKDNYCDLDSWSEGFIKF